MTKSPAQPGATSQTAAQATTSKPSTPSTAPATQAPAQHPSAAPSTPAAGAQSARTPAKPEKKIDLNNASLAELKTLSTVGDAEAEKIIANRPYKSKGELVTKAGLPEGVYQAIRHKVEMQTPRKPAPKK